MSSFLLRVLPWFLALWCAVLATVFFARSRGLRAENESLQAQRELADVAARLATAQRDERSFLAEKLINDLGNLRRFEWIWLRSSPHGAVALLLWDPIQNSGWLACSGLPDADTEYTLWLQPRDRRSAAQRAAAIVGAPATPVPVRLEQPLEGAVDIFLTAGTAAEAESIVRGEHNFSPPT